MNLKALIDELGTVTAQYGAIVKEFDGKEIPAEKRAELKKLHVRGLELKTQIQTKQAEADETKDMNELTDYLRRPQPTVPLPVGRSGASDGRKVLTERGWEQKGDMWFAPTSKGLYPIYGDTVLFGDLPQDATGEEIAYQRTARVAMQPQYKAAYNAFIRNCVKVRSESMAMMMLSGIEQKALSEGTDTAGGFLVPPDYQAEMLVRKAAIAVFRRAGARVQPTSRDTLRYPMVQAASTTAGGSAAPGTTGQGGDSIFAGGFVGSWAGETPAFTDTDPVFGLFNVPVKKIRAATKLANDFVADSAVDVVAWLARNGAENMALVEDFGFFQGDGSALKPKGIVASGAATVNLSGSTANTISNTTSAVGSAPKIIDLWAALPPQYDAQARMAFSKQTEAAIRKLVDAQGRFMFPVFSGSQFGSPPREIQGYPIENTPFLLDANTAAAGKTAVVLADFSNYIIAERAQISTVLLRERFADTDQLGIILFERVGGDVWNLDGVRLGIL
jgi:HK97 family phage major capsid protein